MDRKRLYRLVCLIFWLPAIASAASHVGAGGVISFDPSFDFNKAALDALSPNRRLQSPNASAPSPTKSAKKVDKNPSAVLGVNQAELDRLVSESATQPNNPRSLRNRQDSTQKITADTLTKLGATKPQPSSIGITTGSIKETYYALGVDIAKIAANKGLTVNVKSSAGSLENLRRMASSENAGLAIVQSDVIEFLSQNPSPTKPSIVDNLKSVFSLYDEEIHLLARKNIKTLTDLNNKRVIVGELASGTPITANRVFDKVGVDIEPITGVAPEEALKKLIVGEVDAIFFVGGKPISYIDGLLEMSNNDKLRKYTDDIHLVPIDDERLNDAYTQTNITPADYQSKNGRYRLTDTTIPTVAVQALLISYDFAKNDSPYYTLRCQQVNTLHKVIKDRLSAMAADDSGKYHPKWAQVNLNQATTLAKSQCISATSPVVNDLKAIDCYLQTGKSCK